MIVFVIFLAAIALLPVSFLLDVMAARYNIGLNTKRHRLGFAFLTEPAAIFLFVWYFAALGWKSNLAIIIMLLLILPILWLEIASEKFQRLMKRIMPIRRKA